MKRKRLGFTFLSLRFRADGRPRSPRPIRLWGRPLLAQAPAPVWSV